MNKPDYSKTEDYLVIVTGKISNIIEFNTEYPAKDKDGNPTTRFKNVFSLSNPRISDPRFDTCISWERQTIRIGDIVNIKGRYLNEGFLVKGLMIYKRGKEC